jgi:hypothetical protein
MATIPPFDIEIFDKAYIRQGWIGNPTAVVCTPKHNQVDSLSVTVPTSHNRLEALTARGARLVAHYRGEQAFSGMITRIDSAGPERASEVTVTAEGDERLLWRMVGYPVPGNAIGSQNALVDKRSGSAETVLKGYVSANLAGPSRWPTHQLITIAEDLERGDDIDAAIGMQPLADVLLPLIEQAGIGFTVRQLPGNGNGLELDVYEPASYPRPLSEDGGTVLEWSWSRTAPTATRAIVGGPEDDETGLRPWLVATQTGAETAWYDVIETVIDQASEDNSTARLSAGLAAVAEQGEKNGFSVVLGENTSFSYGGPGGVHVGDLVQLQIAGQTITDVLREASIVWDKEGGFRALPVVGELATEAHKLASFIDRIARNIRALTAR